MIWGSTRIRGIVPTIMENQMEKKIKMKWKLGLCRALGGLGGFLQLGIPFCSPRNKDYSMYSLCWGPLIYGNYHFNTSYRVFCRALRALGSGQECLS